MRCKAISEPYSKWNSQISVVVVFVLFVFLRKKHDPRKKREIETERKNGTENEITREGENERKRERDKARKREIYKERKRDR